MDSFLEHIWREWSVISAAPLTFAILAILMFGAAFIVVNWHYQGRLDTAKDRIDSYKDKLDGATPDEAKARLDALQAEVDSLKPRRLAAGVRQQIQWAMASMKGTIEIGVRSSAIDGQGYAKDLGDAFHEAGWSVALQTWLGNGGPEAPSGLGLLVADPNGLKSLEAHVASLLRMASIQFDILRAGARPASIGTVDHGTPDVRLQVNAKAA